MGSKSRLVVTQLAKAEDSHPLFSRPACRFEEDRQPQPSPNLETIAQPKLHDARLRQGLIVLAERCGYVNESQRTG